MNSIPKNPKTDSPRSRYQDRPSVTEQFADSVRGLTFDGQTVRIELCIERQDSLSFASPTCSSTACRLVLTPDAAIALHDQLSAIVSRDLMALKRNAGR